ncbi:hypothetical protein BWI17_07485 [Betaproteobacteria bacterium GR16-43]|nr:hypothetical protein BWI17_07485 [Betaproteobacteria bacterium GR16-43]
MPDLLLYLSTAGLWLALAGLAWRAARPAVAAGPAHGPDVRIENLLVPVALVLHAMLLYRGIVVSEGLNLGVANAVSLLVWLTALIYWLAGLAYRSLSPMQGLMAPIALVAVVLQGVVPSRHVVTYTAEPLFTMHFAIAMLAYALVIVATLHALVMLAEEKWLHRGVLPPFLKALPPLMEMEALLFRILLAAFILLTLTVVTGVFFSELLFGKPFAFSHKNVFAMLSWLIFGGLLAGHHLRGWRGKTAVRWTLAGFFMLLLAYVGSKFVLEIILKR